MKKIIAVALIFCLLFVGCSPAVESAPVDYEPPQEEPFDAPMNGDRLPAAPAEVQEPGEVEEPREAARVWTIEETQAMEWPELFATLVGRLADEAFRAELDRGRGTEFSFMLTYPPSFAIMDINFDGEQQLLVSVGSPSNNYSMFYVFTIDAAKRFLQADSVNAYRVAERESLVLGEEPLRFFRNDSTGMIIFSSLQFVSGGGTSRIIHYTDANTFELYRSISCSYSDGKHKHILWDAWASDPSQIETLTGFVKPDAVFDASFFGYFWDARYWPCDIDFGRNSQDPSVVTLVNMALEGFTEIPAPQGFRFPGEFERIWLRDGDGHVFGANADDVQNVQNWIFEVAQNWE